MKKLKMHINRNEFQLQKRIRKYILKTIDFDNNSFIEFKEFIMTIILKRFIY